MTEVKAAISVTIKEDGKIIATAVSNTYRDVNTPKKIWKLSVFSKKQKGYIEVRAVAYLLNLIQKKPDHAIPWSLVFENMKFAMYQLTIDELEKEVPHD